MSLAYVWDYDINEAQFKALLDGEQTIGRLDADWAALRLLEYAPCHPPGLGTGTLGQPT